VKIILKSIPSDYYLLPSNGHSCGREAMAYNGYGRR